MKRALPAGEYFVMLTVTGHTADGASGTAGGRSSYTLVEPATERALFEQMLANVVGKSTLVGGVDAVIVTLWHVSACG